MIRSSVTISLVPEARGGPFVFQGDLEKGLSQAASLGFDAIELFLPSPDSLSLDRLRRQLRDRNLLVSALGTGSGFLKYGWTLCSPQPTVREKAFQFIQDMMELAVELHAPIIIGSMKGSVLEGEDRETVLKRLGAELSRLTEKAQAVDGRILLEPLNRYETNLVNTLKEGVSFLEHIPGNRILLLADLFHMNIEEDSIWQALSLAKDHLGYLHFVDSNRRAPGFGHLNFGRLAKVLREIRYDGFLSAEALPHPSSEEAARKTIEYFQRFIQPLAQERTL